MLPRVEMFRGSNTPYSVVTICGSLPTVDATRSETSRTIFRKYEDVSFQLLLFPPAHGPSPVAHDQWSGCSTGHDDCTQRGGTHGHVFFTDLYRASVAEKSQGEGDAYLKNVLLADEGVHGTDTRGCISR